MVTFIKTLGIVLLGSLILLSLTLASSRYGRAAVKSALFIPQVFDIGIKPLEWFTPTPIVEHISFPIQRGIGQGDLYRPPGNGPYGATVLFLGVQPAGPQDPRVVNLGKALARANMVTLFYWSPLMANNQMDISDVENLVGAFQFLSRQAYVDPTRIGMAGFCVGASFVLMAAANQAIHEDVAFVNAFGPYFDMQDLVLAITSQTTSNDGSVEQWIPDDLTRKISILQLTHDLSPEERKALRGRFMNGNNHMPTQNLSIYGDSVNRLLTKVAPEEASIHLRNLEPITQQKMRLISPSNYVEDITAQVLIMHDKNDKLIPVAESRRLAHALSQRGNVKYTEYENIFSHVTPNIDSGIHAITDLFMFFKHMHTIMLQAT